MGRDGTVRAGQRAEDGPRGSASLALSCASRAAMRSASASALSRSACALSRSACALSRSAYTLPYDASAAPRATAQAILGLAGANLATLRSSGSIAHAPTLAC